MAVGGILLAQLALSAAEPQILSDLSLDELSMIQVVSVSRHVEPLWRSASAISVISSEDIRRSGATLLAETLRMSVGTEVGMINSRSYAVSIRGFNGTSANKLLPLIDGRSLYSMRFSGTIWDQRNILLDEIDQIEVVRGPGGAAWGANAVNGVINIITKDAEQTIGTRMSAGGGTLDRAMFSARHGFKVGDSTWVRLFGGGFLRGESDAINMPDPNDSWAQGRGGFRMDSRPTERSHLTLGGEVFAGEGDQLVSAVETDRARFRGGDFRAKLRQEVSEQRWLSLQFYYDGFRRDSGSLVSGTDVFDWEAQHEVVLGDRQYVTMGLNYRLHRLSDNDAVVPSGSTMFDPHVRMLKQAGVFFQDDITLVPERLRLNLGTKVEHDSFSGWNPLPSARLAWTPAPHLTLWTAVSRAVRIPSRAENDLTFSVPSVAYAEPSTSLHPEVLVAYEAGFRARASASVSFDVAAYLQEYDDLVGSEAVSAGPPSVSRNFNLGRGRSAGVEISGEWKVVRGWRLRSGVTLLDLEVEVENGRPANPGLERIEGQSPSHQFWIRSSSELGRSVEFDAIFRYVGELADLSIPAYPSLDLRLGWKPRAGLELSITGQNLLDSSHAEFRFLATRWAVPRAVYAKVALEF